MPIPLFSIVVPTYNRARLIDRALESVLAQSEPSWEVLIADDGSTDGTWASLCDWKRRDDRLYCWRHANRGQAASRNALLEHARGHWVAFLDSDDEFLPDHLALRRAAIASQPATDLWLSPMHIVGNPLVPCCVNPGELIHIDRCIGVGMLTIRREAILQAGGFPEVSYAEDSALMTRLKATGIRTQWLTHRSYVYHRNHADTITGNRSAANSALGPAGVADHRRRVSVNAARSVGRGVGYGDSLLLPMPEHS
ncbi:MAG: glycosyltransferase family A protein [Rhodanobacter sp.]